MNKTLLIKVFILVFSLSFINELNLIRTVRANTGNYWSDYMSKYSNASEVENSGIGNTPYVIDVNNVDYFPIMVPFNVSPSVSLFPTSIPSSNPVSDPFPTTLAVASIAVIAVIAVGILVYFKKYRK